MKTNWVLLRGLGREAKHWANFPQELSNSFENGKVLALDFPGWGSAKGDASPWLAADVIPALRKKLQEAALEGPTYLLGVSLGGMVALHWAARYPEDFKGTVLINSSFRGLNPFFHRLRWQIWSE